MTSLQYQPIDRILAKLHRDLPSSFNIEEDDVIEWIGEALEGIGAYSELSEKVYFLQVENYRCTIPSFAKYIVQISKHSSIEELPLKKCLAKINQELVVEQTINPCFPVLIDCQSGLIGDYDIAYYRPYFSLDVDYGVWLSSNTHRRKWEVLKNTQNTTFDSVGNKDFNLYRHSTHEYKVEAPILRFSFEKGIVAITLAQSKLDDKGLPMIPDSYMYSNAIKTYIILRLMEKDFYAGREGSSNKLNRAEAEWQFYCRGAGNESIMTRTVDEYDSMRHLSQQMIPQTTSNYFGNLGNIDQRNYLKRNLINGYNQSI